MKFEKFLAVAAITVVAVTGCYHDNDVEHRGELAKRGLCAHRGAMDTHPENTLTAFREAIRIGAHMIEFDIRLTRDGELVIMHDPTVDRTTDGKGQVVALTLAEIKKLDAGGWKSSRFEGEQVPTLKEALDTMPENIWLNIHLRGGDEIGRKAAQLIVDANRLHQAFLACVPQAAQAARTVEPAILICNMDRQTTLSGYLESTIAAKADFIQLRIPFDSQYPAYIRRLKENGIRINYYLADSAEDLPMLFDAGVDFPLVNDIARSIKAAEELGIEPLKPMFRDSPIYKQ